MRIAWYERPTKDSQGESFDWTWDELAARLSRFHFGSKDTAPGWAPHECEGPRRNENVRSLSALCLDVDKQPDDVIAVVLEATNGYARLVHTTHSHEPGKNCIRVILPLAEPIPVDEWRGFWDSAIGHFGVGELVDELRDPARFYYVPSSPSPEREREFLIETGPFYDVTKGFGQIPAPTADTERAPSPPSPGAPRVAPVDGNQAPTVKGAAIVPAGAIDLDAVRLAIRQNEWGRLLLKGEPLATIGNRHNAIRDAANAIARLAPEDAPIEALEELFADSFAAMDLEGIDAWADLRLALESARPWWAERREERRKQFEVARGRLNFGAKPAPIQARTPAASEIFGQDGKYTPEVIERWAQENDCDAEEFQRRWIVSVDTANFLFFAGKYQGAVPDRVLDQRARDFLEPAPIRLYDEGDKDGLPYRRLRPQKALKLDYGTVLQKLSGSLQARSSYIDFEEDCFVEALCPLRDVTPKEHPEIAEWIRLLVPDEKDRFWLERWMATVTELDRPTSALYLWGPKGCGKNLLAKGLSRFWTKIGGTTEMDAFVGDFNSQVAACPLIFADECLPTDVPNITAVIRRLLGNSVFRLKRKFLPDANVEGYPRLMIASNESSLFADRQREGDLSGDSMEAFAERIRIIHVSGGAVPFLKARQKEIGAWAWTGDGIAEHALWLRETLAIDRTGRFLVPGAMDEVHQSLQVSDYQGAVLQFIALALDKKPVSPDVEKYIHMGGGKLLVCGKVFLNARLWEEFVGREKTMSVQRTGKAMANLARGQAERFEPTGPRYYSIKPEYLKLWVERNGIGDWELIKARIDAPIKAKA